MQCQIFSAVRISQSQVGGETRDLVSGGDPLFEVCSKKSLILDIQTAFIKWCKKNKKIQL